MARKDLKKMFKGNEVINCKTFEEDVRVRNILQEYDFKWASGDAMTMSFWEDYKDRTCINPFDCLYASKEYYTENGKKIIDTETFIKIVNRN